MTGGEYYDYDDGWNDLSSTEMMVKGDSSWSEVPDSLPARMGLQIISIDNQILTSGKLEKLVEIIFYFDQIIFDISIPIIFSRDISLFRR